MKNFPLLPSEIYHSKRHDSWNRNFLIPPIVVRGRLILFLILILFFFLITSCSSAPEIEGFDPVSWKSDLKGCEGIRASMVENASLEENLIGISESDVVLLMGKPDENNLYKRNQKFYVYYLGPCEEGTEAPYLQLRFSATNVTREAMVYQP
jgi:outer membrane protein assembly factor BamE (lipoprotein component of BamABCDE complex)